MTEDTIDTLGRAADDLDAALCFTNLPVAQNITIDALKAAVTKARDTLVRVVRASGEDPWAGEDFVWFGEPPK